MVPGSTPLVPDNWLPLVPDSTPLVPDSWFPTPPTPVESEAEGIRVSGPVTDSVLTTFDCNCHCQDSSVVVGLLAFVCGAAAALACICICKRCQREEVFVAAEQVEVARRAPVAKPTLAIEYEQPQAVVRRAVVTPSSRR